MRRIACFVLSVALASVFTATPAWAALPKPVKVLVLPASQDHPFSNGAYLAFTSNSNADPNHANAYAFRYSNGNTRRINEAGTAGWAGGIDPGTNKVIYQQTQSRISDIYTFGLDTGKRTKQTMVSTDAWDWNPRISDTFISVLRDYHFQGTWFTSLYLYDRSTGKYRKLDTVPASRKQSMINGSVGDRYATWTDCRTTCVSYIYDAKTRDTDTIQRSDAYPHYATAVDETNGLVFFATSGFHCGGNVAIFQVPIATPGVTPTKVANLPSGYDLDDVASLTLNTKTNEHDYYLSRWNCQTGATDIFAIRGVSPGPV